MKIFLVILILILGSSGMYAQSPSLVVISHQKGSPPAMKKSELRSIFLGEKQRWRNGQKIVIALMKTNTEAGKGICEKVYDMSSDDVKKYWLALVFQGKAEAPAFFNSITELQAFVAENPGAIGIVDASVAPANTQVVLIDGKKSF